MEVGPGLLYENGQCICVCIMSSINVSQDLEIHTKTDSRNQAQHHTAYLGLRVDCVRRIVYVTVKHVQGLKGGVRSKEPQIHRIYSDEDFRVC